MAANTITRDLLRRLADVHPDRGRVLSVFLNLDPAQFATPAARSTAITSVLTEATHRVEEAEGLDHDEREALKTDVERVREALQASDIAQNGTRAVAVYACSPADLLEVVRLRRPVDSGVVLDRAPHVEPLVADAASERWCVVLANRRNARLFVGDGGGLEETDRVEDDVHSQHDQGGWSQARYQRGVEKEKDDHLVHVADVAFALYKRRGFDRLLIGAPDELVNELKAKLHPYLRERIVGRIDVDVENTTPDQVLEAAGVLMEKEDTRREREALDRLEAGLGTGGRGAAGLDEVLGMLNERRVEILLIEQGLTAPGVVCPNDGWVGSHGTTCPVDGTPLEQSARTIVVRHHDDLGPLGGIGAVLRY